MTTTFRREFTDILGGQTQAMLPGERLSGEALEPMPMTPEEFGRYMRDDIARWSRVAKQRNIEITD